MFCFRNTAKQATDGRSGRIATHLCRTRNQDVEKPHAWNAGNEGPPHKSVTALNFRWTFGIRRLIFLPGEGDEPFPHSGLPCRSYRPRGVVPTKWNERPCAELRPSGGTCGQEKFSPPPLRTQHESIKKLRMRTLHPQRRWLFDPRSEVIIEARPRAGSVPDEGSGRKYEVIAILTTVQGMGVFAKVLQFIPEVGK